MRRDDRAAAVRGRIGHGRWHRQRPDPSRSTPCPSPRPRSTRRCSTARRTKSFAYPAINVTSSQTLNAAIRGFAEAGSDGIVQVSTGGAEYLSGPTIKDMVTGSVALAEYAQVVAKSYDVNIALHTDHCPKDKLDGFVRPLLALSAERVDVGRQRRCSSRTCGTGRPCRSTRTS